MLLKKGIQVKIISGKDKGKTGEILEINKSLQKIKGGIVSKESFLHQSNVKSIDEKKEKKVSKKC